MVPNQVNASTIRKALTAAGITTEVRITSGKHTTTVQPVDWADAGRAARMQDIADALRPLWSDDRVEVSTFDVSIRRAGWHTTAPLEVELEVLGLNDVDPGRIRELRESSTARERTAELAQALTSGDPTAPVYLSWGGWFYRLAVNENGRVVLEGRLIGFQGWVRDELELTTARSYVKTLLERVDNHVRWARTLGVSPIEVDA